MEKLNYKNVVGANKNLLKLSTMKKMLLLCVVVLAGTGCKKLANEDRDYGYAKIIVKCEKKCNVMYGMPDKVNSFEVEASTATYYQRYQRNYSLEINITPVDADQNIDLSVYSREEKQIFHNSVVRLANVLWNSKIVIP
jgi:hypothetical protein